MKEHNWIKTDEGFIDYWQYSTGVHNGPKCIDCEFACCVHCRPNIEHAQECPGKGK